MSTDMQPTSFGATMTQFAGRDADGNNCRKMQVTMSCDRKMTGQKDFFQCMQFTQDEAWEMGQAMMEWAADRRKEG